MIDNLNMTARGDGSPMTLAEVEVEHVKQVLKLAQTQRLAARFLGLSRWSLSRRIAKHNLVVVDATAEKGASSAV